MLGEGGAVDALAQRFAAIPGVVAVALGGSRATAAADEHSDWDFGLYYRGTIDPADVAALGYPGQVFAPGEWGHIVNGGAWLTVEGVKVDLVYRDIDQVLAWTADAERGVFAVEREVGYVAGIPTYLVAGELASNRVLVGALPSPPYPDALRKSAPGVWQHLGRGALDVAAQHAARGERVGCLANVAQAILQAAHARLAAAGEWVLNEKRLVARAGLAAASALLEDVGDLGRLTEDVDAMLGLPPRSSRTQTRRRR